MRHKSAFEEKTVGCVLASGCGVSVLAIGLIWLFSVAGIYHGTFTREPVTNRITDAGTLNLLPLMILLLVVGVLLIGGAIGYGLWRNANDAKGARVVQPQLRILSRMCYEKGILLTTDIDIEMAERPRFYVRAQYPNGEVDELECVMEVFYQAGEGMVGEAEIQGRWLGRFTPYIGVPSPGSGGPQIP